MGAGSVLMLTECWAIEENDEDFVVPPSPVVCGHFENGYSGWK